MSRFYWLHGVAGCGKSTVATSVCRHFEGKEQLAGSFFCKRDEENRRDPIRLFNHIAYFLAQANPDFRKALLKTLNTPEFSISRDVPTYFEYVLRRPLLRAKGTPPLFPVVFVIDGLDECNDSGIVAGLLAQLVTDAAWVKLIVAGRDQPQIRNAFCESLYRTLCVSTAALDMNASV